MSLNQKGQAQLDDPVRLPEGSRVCVVPNTITEQAARRKANRWLIENVGNMVMADKPTLTQSEDRIVWRFRAFVTALSHEPMGPIGQVEVAADSGEVLTKEDAAENMILQGEQIGRGNLTEQLLGCLGAEPISDYDDSLDWQRFER